MSRTYIIYIHVAELNKKYSEQISDKCVELSFGPACGTVRLYLPHPQRFAAARTSAKMSKKKGTVDVFTSHVG